jgi:hypothetical protein
VPTQLPFPEPTTRVTYISKLQGHTRGSPEAHCLQSREQGLSLSFFFFFWRYWHLKSGPYARQSLYHLSHSTCTCLSSRCCS